MYKKYAIGYNLTNCHIYKYLSKFLSHNYGIMSPKTLKTLSRYTMSFFYISVGLNHFINPEWFVKIVPPVFSDIDYELVYVSGICEVLFGFLICVPKARYYAAWGADSYPGSCVSSQYISCSNEWGCNGNNLCGCLV